MSLNTINYPISLDCVYFLYDNEKKIYIIIIKIKILLL